MSEWFERFDDRLWLRPDEGAEMDARIVCRALGLARGQRVLDAPCGAGRITVHLARMGCRVTGIDRNRRFLARARQRFGREGLWGRFRRMDLRRLDVAGRFDAIVNWFGSFGYFSDGENADLVRRFARALRPGGRLLIEGIHREWVLRHFRGHIRIADARRNVAITNRWDGRTQRINSRWLLDTGRGHKRCVSSMRLYTPAQFRRLFEQAGLTVETMVDSVAGGPFTRRSHRLAVVGRKPR